MHPFHADLKKATISSSKINKPLKYHLQNPKALKGIKDTLEIIFHLISIYMHFCIDSNVMNISRHMKACKNFRK